MRPHILFIHSHNTGRHIQPYGHAVTTPNLQRLAEEGVIFRQGFAAAPTCSPSRAAFLTGQCPHAAGMLGLGHRGFGLTYPERHLGRFLQAHGYTTVLAGVEHTAAFQHWTADPVGYSRVLEIESSWSEHVTPAVCDFLDQAPADTPLFMSIGFQETHAPFHQPDPDAFPHEDPRFCTTPAKLPDCPELRRDMAGLKASARVLDDAIGQILQALEARGIADQTLVCCFSDHGLHMPRHICNLTDSGLEVYYLIRGPKDSPFRGGQAIDAMVSLLDLYPSVCELADIPAPSWLEGKSLLPLVRGEVDVLHDALYGEVTHHAAPEPMRSIRTTRYKYIRRFDERDSLVKPNVDDSRGKDYLLRQGWEHQPRHQEELYDLVFDREEAHNLADDPSAADVLDDLRSRLEHWMRDTGDPLLDGPYTAPAGTLYNAPDGLSPQADPLVQ